MMFWSKNPSPAGSAVDLSPQGEVNGAFRVAPQHFSLWGRGGSLAPGGGASPSAVTSFSAQTCTIWNDISRALESK